MEINGNLGTLRHLVPQAVHTDPIDPIFQGVPFERPIIGRWGCRPFFLPGHPPSIGQLCPVEWFDRLTRPQPATMAEPNVFDRPWAICKRDGRNNGDF